MVLDLRFVAAISGLSAAGGGLSLSSLALVTGACSGIGAGTITANYDGTNKNRTIIGDGAFIGSDTMLVAPVRIGAGARTGAGSVVNKDVPDGALTPVADQIEEMLSPPYRAAAARSDGDTWTAVAEGTRIVELPGIAADEVELTVVDGEHTLTVGEERTDRRLPALEALAQEHESVAIHAERVDGDLFAVDVFPL